MVCSPPGERHISERLIATLAIACSVRQMNKVASRVRQTFDTVAQFDSLHK